MRARARVDESREEEEELGPGGVRTGCALFAIYYARTAELSRNFVGVAQQRGRAPDDRRWLPRVDWMGPILFLYSF